MKLRKLSLGLADCGLANISKAGCFPPWGIPVKVSLVLKQQDKQKGSLQTEGGALQEKQRGDTLGLFYEAPAPSAGRGRDWRKSLVGSVQSSRSVVLTLCDPLDCSTPGLPVHHQLPDFTQTHVHRVGDAIQPSHPPSPLSPPALSLSQHQSLFR